jgi:hypothetical protein
MMTTRRRSSTILLENAEESMGMLKRRLRIGFERVRAIKGKAVLAAWKRVVESRNASRCDERAADPCSTPRLLCSQRGVTL